MRLGALYRQVRDAFRKAENPTADLDARHLVSGLLDLHPSDLVLREDDLVSTDKIKVILDAQEQRQRGVPVGRILGVREFYGLEFQLNADTLEPRPDTEILVDTVLNIAPTDTAWRFLDVGTGTGAIAIALAANSALAEGVASDISEHALLAAKANAAMNGVEGRLSFVRGSYLAPFSGQFDWIVSNPPYIASDVVRQLDTGVRAYDPLRALDGGADGLDAYRQLIPSAKELLAPSGHLALEIGFDQGKSVSSLCTDHGYCGVEIIKDLAGQDRVVLAALG